MKYSNDEDVRELFLLLASEQRQSAIVETKVSEFFNGVVSEGCDPKEVAVDLVKVSLLEENKIPNERGDEQDAHRVNR